MPPIYEQLTENALDLIRKERERQDEKWGLQRHENGYWMLILQEELGELAQAQLQGLTLEHQMKEMVQVAAVATAWLENIMQDEMTSRGDNSWMVFPDEQDTDQ